VTNVLLRLPVGEETAGMAQAAIHVELDSVRDSVRSNAERLTGELVTNAVHHAGLRPGDTVGLEIDSSPERLRVTVSHAGAGFGFDPFAPIAVGAAVDGWDLVRVANLADRWGVIANQPNEVWFEIAL
jgi:hypothetical protein